MGWDKKYRYKILAFMIEAEVEDFYIFDLLIWEKTRIGGRRKKGEEPDNTSQPIPFLDKCTEQTAPVSRVGWRITGQTIT